MNRVVMFGAYGFGNLGDNLLAGYYRDLLYQAFPEASRICLTAAPLKGELLPGEVFCPRWRAPQLLAPIRPGDLWIGGGGSLLQNVSSRRSLGYYLALMAAARRRGARVVLLGQGYGPVEGGVWQTAVRKVLSRVEFVETRDEAAWMALRQMGVETARLGRVVDPVWSLPIPDPIRRGENRMLIMRREDRSMAGELRQILSQHGRDRNIKVTVLAPCDEMVLRNAFGERFHGRIESLLGFWDAVQGVEFLLSSRLHGLILAALAGVPVVGMGRDPKIRSLCEELGVGCVRPDDPSTLQTYLAMGSLERSRQFERAQILHEKALQDRDNTLDLLRWLGAVK